MAGTGSIATSEVQSRCDAEKGTIYSMLVDGTVQYGIDIKPGRIVALARLRGLVTVLIACKESHPASLVGLYVWPRKQRISRPQ